MATTESSTSPSAAKRRSVSFAEPYTVCPRCERDCTKSRINNVCVPCERRFQEEMSRSKGAMKTRLYWRRMLKEAQEQEVRYRGRNDVAVEPAEESAEVKGGTEATIEESTEERKGRGSRIVEKFRVFWMKLKG